MHFHAVRDFLHAVPAAGHYEGTGIYRYHMHAAEARREAAPYFAIPILNRLAFSTKPLGRTPALPDNHSTATRTD